MEVREATADDSDAIREIAQRSMEASYTLGPSMIDAAVEEWFGNDALAEKRSEEGRQLFVAEREGQLVGMAEGLRHPDEDVGDILWIHVDPDYRGEGIGKGLLEHVRDQLYQLGVEDVRGLVLVDNADGNAFYRKHGFEWTGEREVEIDGDPHTERIYHEQPREEIHVTTHDGQEVYVDRSDPDLGSMGPLYPTFTDPEFEERYGYQCGHCGTLATAMDAMGRIECSQCGNARKPTRWDAAYL